jgi:hypothetical protein
MKEDWFQNNLTVEEEELRIRVVSSSRSGKVAETSSPIAQP